VSLRIGRAVGFADLDPGGEDEDRYRRAAERLRAKVAELAPPESAPPARPRT
jgi:hypothetical protein